MAATTVRGMSRDELLALPVSVPIDTASQALGIGRTKGQRLARTGAFPVRVLVVGAQRKVAAADLWTYLGISPEHVA